MRFHTVREWLQWQEGLHPTNIDLGLQRLQLPFQNLNTDFSDTMVFTVAGTNGKGSCVTILSAILQQAGYRVGTYTSPHLFDYSERIQFNNECINDTDLMTSFSAVDAARQDATLTYFEFATLAAFDYFNRQQCDVLVLEVGLGGRLDAVNIVDPDVAIITSIGIDHTDWLGSTKDEIAYEKSGILREQGLLVCGEKSPPKSLLERISELNVTACFIGDCFQFSRQEKQWTLQITDSFRVSYPIPKLSGDFQLLNAATAITAIYQVADKISVSVAHISTALRTVCLPGRFQFLSVKPARIVDVAHNVAAAETLVSELNSHGVYNASRHAVFALQTHKDVDAIIGVMATVITDWHLAPLLETSSVPVSEIEQIIKKYNSLSKHFSRISVYPSITTAWQAADQLLDDENDILLGFGSFFTVAEILHFNQKMRIIL